jgi:hypothetical protein
VPSISIGKKLIGGFLAVNLLVGAVAAFQITQMNSIKKANEKSSSEALFRIQTADAMSLAYANVGRQYYTLLVLSGGKVAADDPGLTQYIADFVKAEKSLEAGASAEEKPLLADIMKQWNALAGPESATKTAA